MICLCLRGREVVNTSVRAMPVYYFFFPSHEASFSASLTILYATLPEEPASYGLLVLQALWERDTSCVMCLCCASMRRMRQRKTGR